MKIISFYVLMLCTFAYSWYEYPFQNFDNGSDSINYSYNLLGGNCRTVNDIKHLISKTADNQDAVALTRSGRGRCLKIMYASIGSDAGYMESFSGDIAEKRNNYDLTDLFYGYSAPFFKNRHIDSICFYAKLDAQQPLLVKIELKDANDAASNKNVTVSPSSQWQRISMVLPSATSFNPATAKLFQLSIGKEGNAGKSGILYLDDFSFVETEYEKPLFENDSLFLDYISAVETRHYWHDIDPVSQCVYGRGKLSGSISTGTLGLQLSACCLMYRKGWVPPDSVTARVEHVLDYLLHTCSHAVDTSDVKKKPEKFVSVNGIWRCFLRTGYQGIDTCQRYSLFSTALLMTGLIEVANCFPMEHDIASMADTLIRMTNWRFMLMPGGDALHGAWSPELGFTTDCPVQEAGAADTLPDVPVSPIEFETTGSVVNNLYAISMRPSRYVLSTPDITLSDIFLQAHARYVAAEEGAHVNARSSMYGGDSHDASYFGVPFFLTEPDSAMHAKTASVATDSAGKSLRCATFSMVDYYGTGYPFDFGNGPDWFFTTQDSAAVTPLFPDDVASCLKYHYQVIDDSLFKRTGYRIWSPVFGFPDTAGFHMDNGSDTVMNRIFFQAPLMTPVRFGIDICNLLLNIDDYYSARKAIVAAGGRSCGKEKASDTQLVVITMPPVDVMADEGETAVFFAGASGLGLHYQWQKDGADIPNATCAEYIMTSVQMEDSGAAFRCIVSNPAGSVASDGALLHVKRSPPEILAQPEDVTVYEGDAATFIVYTAGSQLAWQWQKNLDEIPGATSAEYTLSKTGCNDSATVYSCIITNPGGSVTSNPVMLHVLQCAAANNVQKEKNAYGGESASAVVYSARKQSYESINGGPTVKHGIPLAKYLKSSSFAGDAAGEHDTGGNFERTLTLGTYSGQITSLTLFSGPVEKYFEFEIENADIPIRVYETHTRMFNFYYATVLSAKSMDIPVTVCPVKNVDAATGYAVLQDGIPDDTAMAQRCYLKLN